MAGAPSGAGQVKLGEVVGPLYAEPYFKIIGFYPKMMEWKALEVV